MVLLSQLCGDQGIGPSGCALFAFEVYGGNNRMANEFYFQPVGKAPFVGKVAYTNSIYFPHALLRMGKETPTKLIQVRPWDAGSCFY